MLSCIQSWHVIIHPDLTCYHTSWPDMLSYILSWHVIIHPDLTCYHTSWPDMLSYILTWHVIIHPDLTCYHTSWADMLSYILSWRVIIHPDLTCYHTSWPDMLSYILTWHVVVHPELTCYHTPRIISWGCETEEDSSWWARFLRILGERRGVLTPRCCDIQSTRSRMQGPEPSRRSRVRTIRWRSRLQDPWSLSLPILEYSRIGAQGLCMRAVKLTGLRFSPIDRGSTRSRVPNRKTRSRSRVPKPNQNSNGSATYWK
jgi:hypothetical protein